ncbi:MAG: glycosyltransferase family 2 protein [Eubacteriales bacterium]|nr:glycosyltransferase family 2 protein [Eubacteriales bacterium]
MESIMVSVVMPAYNSEKYIGDAIASVVQQSFTDWELIVVLDSCTDHTLNVVKQYTDDERIQYIENEKNAGVAISRNRGVAIAKGKYVAFLDADDCWTKDKLAIQVKKMEEEQVVISSVARELMNENGDLTGKVFPIQEKITYKELLKGNTINTSGVMLLTDVAKEFPMGRDHLHEDYITWLQILQKYGMGVGIKEPLLKYRFMQGTKSGNKWKSAKMTYGVYRAIGLNTVQSIWCFVQYAIHGILKYFF